MCFWEKEKIIFGFILFVAAAMRLWNFSGWSFSHDELSALIRLRFDSLNELFAIGIRPDGHPSFTQLLLWFWTKTFGLSEFAVRLPFVAAGIGSVALLFSIGKKWFGLTTASFASLSLAVLEFPVLYSQMARPYSFGLFFSLLAVWCWTNLLFSNTGKVYFKSAAFGIAVALCMYTHYFSFFFSLLVAGTGFFFLKKDTWKPYLAAGLIALLVFLPHISISLSQFGKSGVGEWLAEPENDFLWKHLLFVFNDSSLVFICTFLLFILSVVLYFPQGTVKKLFRKHIFHFICLIWFLAPFFAGYYYSRTVNPVLQHSVLLFSFPFLLLFFFSFFGEKKTKLTAFLLGTFAVILLYSTIIEQKFYKREFFAVFRELNEKIAGWHKQYGTENITTVLNSSARQKMDFYFERFDEKIPFDYLPGDTNIFTAALRDKINSCRTPYFIYGWSNFYSPNEIPEMLKRKFPCVIEDEKHFNSQATLFYRNTSCQRDTVLYEKVSFEEITDEKFSFDRERINMFFSFSGKNSLYADSSYEFCITYKTSVKNVFQKNNCFNVSGMIFPLKENFNAQMVMELDDGKGKNYHWYAKLINTFVTENKKWQEVFCTFELPSSSYPDDVITIYLWNQGKSNFYLDDFIISSFNDSDYNMYEVVYRK